MITKPLNDYDAFAIKYAANVDTKPIHEFYERPTTWSLLPDTLRGLKILDLGCGSGWYAEKLLAAGAEVTAIDASLTMVEFTKERLGGQGRVFLHNMEEPFTFLNPNEFDIVLAPLVIHYANDWDKLFKEISRVTKSGGYFIFSTHQPQTEYRIFNLNNYFDKVVITDYWQDIDAKVKFYHHTLTELVESLCQAKFRIEKLLEPFPSLKLKELCPDLYPDMKTHPWFLFIKTIKL